MLRSLRLGNTPWSLGKPAPRLYRLSFNIPFNDTRMNMLFLLEVLVVLSLLLGLCGVNQLEAAETNQIS